MIIGIPREIKTGEDRVAMTPAGVHEFTARGHRVVVEAGAGAGSGISDEEYAREGAQVARDAAAVFAEADMIIKVKEPQESEIPLLRPGQILYTYLHLAADRRLTERLLARGIVAIAYETIERDGKLVCLEPMSEIAGKIGAIMAAYYLARPAGGAGTLAGGVTGVHSANILVLGGGTAGLNAARVAAGMGARVTVMDIDLERMRYLEDVLPRNCEVVMSNRLNIEAELPHADAVIGAVLIPAARAPRLITRSMLGLMKKGTVIVDIAIDQGGCVETARPTTHLQPVFVEEGVVHYCVANMPGAYPRTSTFALVNATLPFGLAIADRGWREAALQNDSIARGINIVGGWLTQNAVAAAHGMDCATLDEALGLRI